MREKVLGIPILLKILSENRFSGKAYLYTIASRSGPLPLSDEEEEEAMETDDGGDHKKAAIGSKLELVRKLLSIVKGGKVPMRVREKAALALGKVCVGDQGFRHSRDGWGAGFSTRFKAVEGGSAL